MKHLVLVALAATVAEADPVELGVNAHVGLGTPIGVGGLGVEANLPHARLEVGIGYALTGSVQYAIGVTGLLGPARRQLGLGLGASMGGYVWGEIQGVECDEFCDERTWDRAYWVNGQVEYRMRIGESWHVAPYAGMSVMLNSDDFTCTAVESTCMEPGKGKRLVFVGAMLGRRL